MENLEKFNSLRNTVVVLALVLCLMSSFMNDGTLAAIVGGIGIVALVIGNILNFMYVKKIRQAQKK